MSRAAARVRVPGLGGDADAAAEERYESLLKAYNVPIKGDTAAKRQALREFIGLTPPS